MQSILQRWQELPRDDLFVFWQQEAQLRKELRQGTWSRPGLKIRNREQFVFLRQSLAYGEHRPLFLQIVFDHMDSAVVQNGLLQGPPYLVEEFLRFLPRAIRGGSSSRQHLQALISLYRDEFYEHYAAIAAVLEEPECNALLEKTANKNLRKLLKDRCAQLRQEQAGAHYGLLQPASADAYPTVYGERTDLLRQAAAALAAVAAEPAEHMFLRVSQQLEAAEALFMAGLVTECLALLQSARSSWQADKTGLPPEDHSRLTKSFSRILAKALAVFALINDSAPYQYAENLYRTCFPEFAPDNNALVYLGLYQSLGESDSLHTDYDAVALTRWFIRLEDKSNRLAAYFINGVPLDEAGLSTLLAEIEGDVTAMPHRALATLEILRFLGRSGRLSLSKTVSRQLLRHCLDLYQWLPAPPFFTRDMAAQLMPAADASLQAVAEKMRGAAGYTRTSIRALFRAHPEKFAGDNGGTLRSTLLGSFLGGN